MSAGRLLARITVAPALLLVAWLTVSAPLLLGGVFDLGPALVLFVPVALVVLWLGLRDAPRADGEPRPGPIGPVPRWSAAGVLLVAVAFLAVQVAMCSEQIIVRRDPASYVQFALWLNDHGSLPIPQDRAAFGGGDHALGFGSLAFYQVGGDIDPQFMAGLPLVLSFGGWLGGVRAMLLMAPLLGAAAVLAFGGLVARLVGPRWAPVGALLLALTLPMIWVSRSTYSELPAMVLLFGGLAMLYDVRAQSADEPRRTGRYWRLMPTSARAKAFLAGAMLGLIVLVRIDGLRDVLPVVVFAGLLVARRRRTGVPLALGLTAGVALGLAEGFILSRPYLNYLRASLVPLLAMTVALVALTVVMVVLLRWERTGPRLRALAASASRGRIPDVAAWVTLAVVALFVARPWIQTVRRVPANPDDQQNAHFIEEVQRINHLPLDGTRQYSELSMHWVIWYIGVPALLAATFGAALLVRRLLRRRTPEWLLPYGVIVWTTVLVLYRPGITPDHPWASRRLIAVVIPGLLLLAVWAAAWLVRRVRRTGYGRRPTAVVAVAACAVLGVPIGLSSAPFMMVRTHQHEVAAVRDLCARIGPGRSVVILDQNYADQFLQVIRSMCGEPAARISADATPGDVQRVAGKIYDAGRVPVLMGASAGEVAPYGQPVHAMTLRTRQDERTLVKPPKGTWTLNLDVWITEPPRP